jgi:4-methylaminobutanoate oxidase (formaldehyde-forming)
MEKGYRHWGDDIHDHITPLQAGLAFATAKNKDNYIGKAHLDNNKGVQTRRLVSLAIDAANAPLMLHDEPIRRDGIIVGLTTSAAWGHRVGKSLAMAELSNPEGVTAQWLKSGNFDVEVALKRYPITVQFGAFYDPKSEHLK